MAEEIPGNMLEWTKFPIESETRFGRFFNKINQFLKKETPTDLKLAGRIHELHAVGDQVLIDLLDFKTTCEKEIDSNIFALVEGVVDTILKEIARLQKAMQEEKNPASQVKTFKRYTECIDKAKSWINLRGQLQDGTIERLLITHIVKDFHACIDRDIQVIQDYSHHALIGLDIAEGFHNSLIANLEQMLQEHLVELHKLKESPADLSLETFTEWRSLADRSREQRFTAALHLIDTFSQNLKPDRKEKSHERVLSRLDYLEEQINALSAECLEMGEKDQKQLMNSLSKLEEEVHQLNSDLHFPQEYTHRMQQILESLASLRKKLMI